VVCHETNQGHSAAANRAAFLATGQYLAFLDGDDAFAPWALEVHEKIIQAKKPMMILAGMCWFEGTLPAVKPGDAPDEIQIVEYKDYLRKDRPFGYSASALVIDRHSFQSVGGWSTDIWPINDVDLVLKLCASGPTVQILATPTVFHRSHAANSVKNIPPFLSEMHKIIDRAHRGLYPGTERSREQDALVGGPILHHAKRAFGAGLYWDATKLLAHGWPMVLAAATRRLGVMVSGRHPRETIKI
jgi:glycosyltransferase involved in cell wall biosynthesis